MDFLCFAALTLACGFVFVLKLYLDGRKEKEKLKNALRNLEKTKYVESENTDSKVSIILLLFIYIESG